MKVDAEIVGLSLLAAGEVPNFLAGALPSFMTIKRFAGEQKDVDTLREGELWGSTIALVVGLGASMAAKHPLPFITTVGVLIYMLVGYERAIANPHSDAKNIGDQ